MSLQFRGFLKGSAIPKTRRLALAVTCGLCDDVLADCMHNCQEHRRSLCTILHVASSLELSALARCVERICDPFKLVRPA